MENFGKKCKQGMMDEMLADIKARPNIFITNYMGLNTQELDTLRRNLSKGDSTYYIVKNSLTKKVLSTLEFDDVAATVDGGVGIGLAGADFITACKVLAKFSKEHSNLKIRAAVLDGKIVTADAVNEIASLPAREVLLAQVVGGIKAPITGLVLVLSGLIRKFVYCIDAIQKSKDSPTQQ